ncbi:Hypothetical protein FNO222_0270 [Francisella orientalis]|uniref:Uncharacterized protein n=1 Tax=Francisella orientalis TaxID=299583 RepID=A0ABN4H2B8_9GAMM|nr:hypothetical protein FNO12_0268 [Francisella orientalis FNO12]AKN86593.1 Hypothetical protein FNO24_0268 [Francisella orientalis FNO24]AKN88131.1 Hypothetical protein FNO190_0268 [Francisella orientalis]AKU04886.1 Hypothetical protein FNO01_0268 [Francisella orientalis]QEN19795.1 Hypothetical protein FNO39_0270 [Francisella orientalis]
MYQSVYMLYPNDLDFVDIYISRYFGYIITAVVNHNSFK